jgi:deoxyribose-phosphate aldolase
MSEHKHARNDGIELDLEWVSSVQCNKAAIERRAASLEARRTVKKEHQLAWLLRVITLIDLTTLAGDDTPGNVKRLCAKAKTPLRPDFVKALDVEDKKITTGAVCVYPSRVPDAVKALEGTGIPVASVATGFPAGQTPLATRLEEIRYAVKEGAKEIDIVLARELVINHKWRELYDEVKAMREACGEAHLKAILAVGELPSYRDIYKASLVCMMAGSDFIKTSTGKERVNATLANSLTMCRAIRDYYDRTGFKVGFKPAGGVSSAKKALSFLSLMLEELGEEWTHNDLFRIGASSLLLDVERQIEHGVTGHYAAKHYFAMQ